MIAIKEVPRTKYSIPFATSVGKLGFEEMGYVEQEYFISGKANIYEEDGDYDYKIIHENQFYVDRIIVRKPADDSKFSGDIVIEILNATAGFDLDRMWILGAKQIMRENAIYIGITSRPEMVDSLQLWDKSRYSELSWKIDFERENIEYIDDLIKPKHEDCDTGLFFDMLMQLAEYVKSSEQEIIPKSQQIKTYLLGWSQSANYMSTYIRRFLNANVDLFDGYMLAGNIHHFVTPLNQAGFATTRDNRLTKIDFMPKPCIAIQTESEAIDFGGFDSRQSDSDSSEFMYRCYEIVGMTHDTDATLLSYYDGEEKREKLGLRPGYQGKNVIPNDYEHDEVFNAIFHHLFAWAKGVTPPAGVRIEVDEENKVKKDGNGNSVGGVRNLQMSVPIETFYQNSPIELPDGKMVYNPLFGYVEPFSSEKFTELYGDLKEYENRLREAAIKQQESGFLLKEDAENAIVRCVARAKAFGLERGSRKWNI